MSRGNLIAVTVGLLLSVLIGFSIAVLPSTPTWTLWRLTQAIDSRDTDELSRLIDIPAVASRTIEELTSTGHRGPEGLNLGSLALALLDGGKVRTVFDDPENRIRITPGEFLDAWWNMRREGKLAYLTIDAAGQPVDLIFADVDLRWQIVGVSPVTALLRVDQARTPSS